MSQSSDPADAVGANASAPAKIVNNIKIRIDLINILFSSKKVKDLTYNDQNGNVASLSIWNLLSGEQKTAEVHSFGSLAVPLCGGPMTLRPHLTMSLRFRFGL
jgi:hypothetical protein